MRWALLLASLAATACIGPYEAREGTVDVVFHVYVPGVPGPPERGERILIVDPVDAQEMGLDPRIVPEEFETFELRTSTTRGENDSVEHCLREPVVIEDGSGLEEFRIPAGACLVTGEPFRVDEYGVD